MDGSTALHIACQEGRLEIVKCLIENGAMVNAKEYNGSTPLLIAAHEGRLEIVKYLIENGAILETQDIEGYTPLHAAAELGRLEIAKCLIINGAMINAKNIKGLTPLHVASNQGRLEMVKCLVENGANIELKDVDNRNPLYIAAKNGQKAIVDYLTFVKRHRHRSFEENEILDVEDDNWKSSPCVVCLVPRFDVFVLWPCGHVSMCESCCAKLMSQNSQFTCPTCRKPIQTYKQIFLQCP